MADDGLKDLPRWFRDMLAACENDGLDDDLDFDDDDEPSDFEILDEVFAETAGLDDDLDL